MAWRSGLLHFATLVLCFLTVYAQTISTTIPVPPLQWINLSSLLNGSSQPPPLKDASIGYDETSRSVIIFGGESEGGFVQSQTYLLNLDTLTWSTPSPPANLQRTPPARSAALGGCDFAASNRHGFVIIGGKGSDGQGLSDVWEYDFNNQFWSEVGLSPGGPSARWGSAGGIDIRTMPIQDPVVPGPNNTFYLAGGFDGTTRSSLSDIWRLNISGTLSSNLPNNSSGSWDRLTIGNLPSKVDQAGTVISHQIIVAGGCNTTLSNVDCPQQDSYVIDAQRRSEISPPACIAPRLSPSLVPNVNTFSSSFSSQVFLLLGTFNTSIWQDDGALEKGEVSVLDINTGSWSRILPSGDPGTSRQPTFPSPRHGSAAFSYPLALVGQSRTTSSDTIVFGGQDASGTYLSEVWVLRAYAGAISPSNPTWSGFGNGQLQSGPTANGAGVTTQYIAKCATENINPSSPNSTTTPSSSASNSTTVQLFDTSIVHKLLAPLSLALLFPAVLLFCMASPSFNHRRRHSVWTYLFVVLAIAAYGSGIAGIATSFTTASSNSSVTKRSSPSLSPNTTLKTGHGKTGLALFIGLYAFTPLLVVLSLCFRRFHDSPEDDQSEKNEESSQHTNSTDSSEMLGSQGGPRSTPQSIISPSPPPSPRPRTHSWGPSSLWQKRKEGRLSSDESVRSASPSASPQRGFEVLNRPSRPHQASGSWLAVPSAALSQRVGSRNLGDIDWLQRRRSLNTVGELDYAITQANKRNTPSTPSTADALMTPAPTLTPTKSHPAIHPFDMILSYLFHVFLLGLCILSLAALWSRAPRATFAVFLAWSLAFYITMLVFAWNRRPENSILTAMITRWANSNPILDPSTSHPSPVADDPILCPTRGPYVHQPPYHAALSVGHDDTYPSPRAPRTVETDDNVEDEDEDTRQRRMEEEMGRRDVSIITVPKRKLWIANPS